MIHRHFGIDVASKTLQVAHVFGRRQYQCSFSNDEAGWEALVSWARALSVTGRLRFCLEHTGGYESGCVQFLQGQGFHVSLLDAARFHHFVQSYGKRGKSDPSDAVLLARFSRERMPEAWVPRPDPQVLYLRLCRARESLVKHQTALKNQCKAPSSMASVREHFEAILEQVQARIDLIESQLSEIESQIPELGKQIDRLDSISGIGKTQARQILSEIGSISAYPNPRRLALAAGLVPLPRLSGTTLNKRGLFPYGNARLRSAAFRAAMAAKRFDPGFKAVAGRISGNGHKSKNTVTTACARKLMHVVWAILTYDQEYDSNILLRDARLPQPTP
jgi:transposase